MALAAAQETKTLSHLAREYELHPSQINEWKQRLLREGATIFSQQQARQQRAPETLQADLYEQIGRLQMELE